MTLVLQTTKLRDPVYVASAIIALNEYSAVEVNGKSAQDHIRIACRNLLKEYVELLGECCDDCRQTKPFVSDDPSLCADCNDQRNRDFQASIEDAGDMRAHAAMDRRAGL